MKRPLEQTSWSISRAVASNSGRRRVSRVAHRRIPAAPPISARLPSGIVGRLCYNAVYRSVRGVKKVAKEVKRVNFDEFAINLPTIFDTMARRKEPVLIEREGQIYRLELEQAQPPENIWSSYDPEKVRRGLKKSAGALAGVDREILLRDMHEAREQASHGRPA